MFHPIDLIAPIGIGLLATFLCLWGYSKAKVAPAKVACLLCACAFLAASPALYLLRWQARKSDYTTQQGVRVRQGTKSQCLQPNVTAHVQWVIDWWQKHCPPKKDDVVKALDDKLLVCADEEKLSAAGRFMRGYSWGSVAVVGYNGDPSYTESLIKHELSHMAAPACGYPLDEEEHHELFKRLKLGH